jgi:hypothetical protein
VVVELATPVDRTRERWSGLLRENGCRLFYHKFISLVYMLRLLLDKLRKKKGGRGWSWLGSGGEMVVVVDERRRWCRSEEMAVVLGGSSVCRRWRTRKRVLAGAARTGEGLVLYRKSKKKKWICSSG